MSSAAGTTSSWLLANREHLSMEKATNYLVGRMRTRTPLGACEYLRAKTYEESGDLYERRIQLAVTKMEMYERMFPREYAASQAPAFSLQREQDFYRLVSFRLFPLDLSEMDRHPGADWFLPFIEVTGTQQHDWENGCCRFDQLQTMFKLVLILSGRREGDRLPGIETEPAPPLDAPAWTFFTYALAVEPSPLRHLVHVFNLTCYSTHNPWLDIPLGTGPFPLEWCATNVAKLAVARAQAEGINRAVMELNCWLDESPKERIGRAVELWNQASAATAREDGRRVYV